MNELITINDKNYSPIQLYTGDGLDPVIQKIEKEARSFVPDMTTEKGRKEIASMAYKVTRSITLLDDAGKNLTEDWRSKTNQVNASRRNMRERLTSIRDKVRQPLTEWEEADKLRVGHHKDMLDRMICLGADAASSWIEFALDALCDRLEEIDFVFNRDWQEFEVKATEVRAQAIINIKHGIAERKAHDKAEADRIEADKKAQADREKRIAQDAAERAKREAEAERKRIADIAAKKLAKVQADKKRAIQAKKDAEAKAKREAAAAKKQAEADKQAAIEAERRAAKLKAQAEKEALEEKERLAKEVEERKAADKRHRAKIDSEIFNELCSIGTLDKKTVAEVLAILKSGNIKHVSINY